MIAAVVVLVMAGGADPSNLCNLCHPGIRVKFEQSVHPGGEVACVSCHGGDPTSSTVEGAHRGDYRGKIRRRDIPRLCASCHADGEKMAPYNLSTDQLALYQVSRHGRGLAAGDENVAVCTDCHGVHAIFPRDDPRSSVFPTRIPETCGRCHADPRLRDRYGWKDDPYADFVASRHGEALMERRDASAPTCSRCHGAHGAAPPGVGDIHKVCGHCHAPARAHFLDSPHREAMDAAGLPECASCHGNHRILKADLGMLDRVCRNCHDAGSDPVELGLEMKTLFTTASDELDKARGEVERAAAIPLYVEDYRARIEEGNTLLIGSLPTMHSCDLEAVENLTGRARSIAREVESEVHGKLEGRKWRRVGLMVFWFYLLLTVGVLVRFRRRAARELPA